MMPIAEVEIDTETRTYTLTNVDERFHDVIDRTIDDLNYIFYQELAQLLDQPWPERLVDTIFEAYDYGAYEQDIRTNIDDLPQDFVLSTITVKQIMIIQQLLASILEQCHERTVFEIVDNVLDRDEWREACDSDSKEIMINIK